MLLCPFLLAVAVINKSLAEIRLPAAWLREEEALPPPLLLLFPEFWSCGSTLMEMALEKTFSPFTSTLAAGLESRISFAKEDCTALTFPDKRFDAITVAFGVRNFEDNDFGILSLFVL